MQDRRTDSLPAGLTHISNIPSRGSYDSNSGIWTVGTIGSGGNATLQITVRVDSNVGVINTVEVTAANESA